MTIENEPSEAIPEPKFHPGDVVRLRYWYDDPKEVFLKTTNDLPNLKFNKLKNVKSTVPARTRMNMLADHPPFCFSTFEDTDDIKTLKLWTFDLKQYGKLPEIDLDNTPPSLTGEKAHEYMVNNFDILGMRTQEYRRDESRPVITILDPGFFDKTYKKYVYRCTSEFPDDEKVTDSSFFEDHLEIV